MTLDNLICAAGTLEANLEKALVALSPQAPKESTTIGRHTLPSQSLTCMYNSFLFSVATVVVTLAYAVIH